MKCTFCNESVDYAMTVHKSTGLVNCCKECYKQNRESDKPSLNISYVGKEKS